MLYRILPIKQSFDTFGLVYKSDENIKRGKMVSISLRDVSQFGVCAWSVDESQLSYNIEDVLEIDEVVDTDFYLSEKHIELIDFVAKHYICMVHHVANLFFPKNLLEKLQKNTLQKVKDKKYIYRTPELKLSEIQQKIFTDIYESELKKHLIYGVTGSGKTQIYMQLIAENLKKWKQSLLLIPEIILTSQIGERIMQEFWDDVLILHSGVSAAKKTQYCMDIFKGEAKIIIGTRSSLFYPYRNLGIIIMDEEHDNSYISDSVPRYHARTVASKLSDLYDIPLVLWSGTPKISTFYKALKKDFALHQILEKYSD